MAIAKAAVKIIDRTTSAAINAQAGNLDGGNRSGVLGCRFVPIRSWGRHAFQKIKGIAAFGHVDNNSVVCPFRGIVLGELRSKPRHLHSNHGVLVWVKIARPAEYFRRNLIFLGRGAGVFQGVVRQVTQEFAERLGTM